MNYMILVATLIATMVFPLLASFMLLFLIGLTSNE